MRRTEDWQRFADLCYPVTKKSASRVGILVSGIFSCDVVLRGGRREAIDLRRRYLRGDP